MWVCAPLGERTNIGGTRHMSKTRKTPSRVWTAENIIVIAILALSWVSVVTAGLYGNGFFA